MNILRSIGVVNRCYAISCKCRFLLILICIYCLYDGKQTHMFGYVWIPPKQSFVFLVFRKKMIMGVEEKWNNKQALGDCSIRGLCGNICVVGWFKRRRLATYALTVKLIWNTWRKKEQRRVKSTYDRCKRGGSIWNSRVLHGCFFLLFFLHHKLWVWSVWSNWIFHLLITVEL